MFDDVLIPTDGSECAHVAVGYAEDIASRFGATVHVLSVADPRELETAPHAEKVRDACADIAAEVAEDVDGAVGSTEEVVRTDLPHEAILEYAAEQSIDLIVMGTHGRTGVERYVLGSVTEKVLRLADVPVLTVRDTDDGAVTYPYEDILVPTDGSEGAGVAVDPAIDLSSAYGARLHALSVVDTMALGIDVRSEAVFETLEGHARDAVEGVATQAEHESVPDVQTAIEYGHPYREILSYVDDNEVDLVVMGTHGRSGIDRYLLGSIAEKLVRTSPVPVMTVRMPESSAD